MGGVLPLIANSMQSFLTEPLSHAPLVERSITITVPISADEFHELAAAWLSEAAEQLELPEHSTVEQWLVKIEKKKDSPPKPKAILYNVPQVHSTKTSLKKGHQTEVVRFNPPTEQRAASIQFLQAKAKDEPILPYETTKRRLNDLLASWESYFGGERFGAIQLSYWNDLRQIVHPRFYNGKRFSLVDILNLFTGPNAGLGTLTPPWNAVLRWEIDQMPQAATFDELPAYIIGSQLVMEVKSEGDGPVWTVFSFLGKEIDSRPASQIIQDLDIAHSRLSLLFRTQFTQAAQDFFRHGKLDITSESG